MNIVLRISLLVGISIYFCILFYLIRKKELSLKYSLLWIFSGLIMLLSTIFPNLMINIIKLLGILDITNGLFLLVLFFIIVILMSITAIVSKMREKNKELIQQCAMLEKRVRALENSSERESSK